MQTPEYADTPPATRQGRPPVPIDPKVSGWLDQTLATGRALMIELSPEHPDAPALLRMMRIYATRRGMAVNWEFVTHDERQKLKFLMRRKRTYRTTPIPKGPTP
jgi:hypothetical protein